MYAAGLSGAEGVVHPSWESRPQCLRIVGCIEGAEQGGGLRQHLGVPAPMQKRAACT